MSTNTPNLNLYKPDPNEFVDEDLALNNNWDLLDTTIQNDIDALAAIKNGNYFHKARLRQSTNQNIPNTTSTAINFDAEDYDVGGVADVATGKFTILRDGYYHLLLWIQWAGNSTGRRVAQIDCGNPLDIYLGFIFPSGTMQISHEVSVENFFTAGTVFSPTVYQGSGGTLALNASRFSIREVP